MNGRTIQTTISSPLFTVHGGLLVLKGEGTVNSRVQFAVAEAGGRIRVESGTYYSSKKEPFRALSGGTVIINGGNLTGAEGAVVCYGDTTTGGGVIEVNGGNLTGLDNFAISTNGTKDMGGNTITINGGHLEGNIKSAGYEAIGVYIANNDALVVNGGEIIANGGTGICMRAGQVTINDGTIIATNVDKDGNVVADGKIGDDPTVMTGCSAIIFHETSNYPGQKLGEMKLIVNGGTITGIDHSIQVLSNAEEPKVYVTGGNLTPAYPEPIVGE